MTKCIVCAQRKNALDIEKAFTCTSCIQFLKQNGLEYSGESIQSYTASFEQILARDENALFLTEIRNRRQDQQNSVLGAIAKVSTL